MATAIVPDCRLAIRLRESKSLTLPTRRHADSRITLQSFSIQPQRPKYICDTKHWRAPGSPLALHQTIFILPFTTHYPGTSATLLTR